MKNKRNLTIILVMTTILLLLLTGINHIFSKNTPDSSTDTDMLLDSDIDNMHIEETEEPVISAAGHPVTLWQQDELYYAFLPAACKNNASLISELPKGIDASSVIWMYSEQIPAVFIDTESGTSESINSSKNVKEPATITILEPDGQISLSKPLEYIKGRGNSTYLEFDKKPYKIKLKDAAPLLGMEEGKNWIFLANACDPSLIRNALARDLANHLGLAQADPGVFIDLYLNGEYVGNYYVTEEVEVKKNRLSITDLEKATEKANKTEDLSTYQAVWTDKTKSRDIPADPEDITGGYLIERDLESRFLKEVEDNGSYFITEAGECFILKSPDYASESQVVYINDFIQSVENAILSSDGIDSVTGNSYEELIDVDSFVRKYLLEEISGNYDGGIASSFFYKDSDLIDGKLYAGPVWDYDISFGNTPAFIGYLSDKPDKLTKLSTHHNASAWFPILYEKSDFNKQIKNCYKDEISPYLTQLANQVLPELAGITAASAAMDRIRWQQQYLENGGDISFEDSIAFLSEYISARKTFLDRVWIEEKPVYLITLYIEGAIYETFSVFEGETLPEFPIPEITYADYDFQGWTTEDGSLPDFTAPIYEDMAFHSLIE